MKNLCPKYIIEDGNLIISKCVFHKDIVTDKEKVQGGGWFKLDYENRTFTFYDDSHDFGKAKLEDVKKAVLEGKVYTNNRLTHSIATQFKFLYNTGSELIPLN